jgi:hypothetical protein
MVMMLLVVGALIRYSSNPDTWRWVERDSNAWADEVGEGSAAKGPAGKSPPAVSVSAPAKGEPAAKTPAKPVRAAKPEAAGPTDEDPEEADSAREELQAVGDRTLAIQPEEMLAYKRILGWTRNQSFAAMLKRANRKVVYNDFVQSPEKFRGKLVALDLTAARVLPIDDKPEGDPIFENLTDLWGASSESGNWLYEAIVVDRPRGMPIGPRDVGEKVRVVGYFFKLQAYQRAGAGLNEPPQVAPIVIGRLAWKEAVIPRVQSSDWLWAGMVAALFAVVIVVAVGIGLLRRRPPVIQSVGIGTSGLTTDQWLDRAEVGEAPLDDADLEHPENEDSAS